MSPSGGFRASYGGRLRSAALCAPRHALISARRALRRASAAWRMVTCAFASHALRLPRCHRAQAGRDAALRHQRGLRGGFEQNARLVCASQHHRAAVLLAWPRRGSADGNQRQLSVSVASRQLSACAALRGGAGAHQRRVSSATVRGAARCLFTIAAWNCALGAPSARTHIARTSCGLRRIRGLYCCAHLRDSG